MPSLNLKGRMEAIATARQVLCPPNQWHWHFGIKDFQRIATELGATLPEWLPTDTPAGWLDKVPDEAIGVFFDYIYKGKFAPVHIHSQQIVMAACTIPEFMQVVVPLGHKVPPPILGEAPSAYFSRVSPDSIQAYIDHAVQAEQAEQAEQTKDIAHAVENDHLDDTAENDYLGHIAENIRLDMVADYD